MSQLNNHLEKFQAWVEKNSSQNTAKNYHSTVKGFYTRTRRQKPIKLGSDEQELEKLSNDLIEYVNSKSMLYGLKKYMDWRSLKSHKFEEQRTAQFIKNKLDQIELNPDKRDIETKLISADTLTQVCLDAGKTDEELGLMLRMMYETAARFSGMNRLTWKDVNREEYSGEELKPHQIFISKDRSKGSVNGVVEISDRTLRELKGLQDERDPHRDDQVFFPELTNASTYQKAWRFFDTHWSEYSTHYLRHSRLTHLGLQMHEVEGLDYSNIKERLRRYARHEDSSTTEIYIEIVKNKLAQKNQDMEKYRSVQWK